MGKIKPLQALYITQFLSAFADNMILFVINTLLLQNGFSAGSLALVSMAFFLPYIILAPLVGALADRRPKSEILLWGNGLKTLGVILLFLIDPTQISLLMLAYFIVGVGAVVYSPAKYGILPDLTRTDEELYQANARIEAYTIIAILAGIGGGGSIAAATTPFTSSLICLSIYSLSIIMTFWIPRIEGNASLQYGREVRYFFKCFQSLWNVKSTRFSLIGTGGFWMNSAVLRIAVLAWIPMALGFDPQDMRVTLILASTSIGIVLGAFFSPKLIPLKQFHHSSMFGWGMLLTILLFPWIHVTLISILLLLTVGFMGGAFIVPMNTVLQERGKELVGSGKTIAVQNLVENFCMLTGSVIYYLVIDAGVSISWSIVMQGGIFLLFLVGLTLMKKEIVREG